jgi:hypothetical protein
VWLPGKVKSAKAERPHLSQCAFGGQDEKPAKNFFSLFLTDFMIGLGASRPRRDLQNHWAKSLTSTLLGAGQFFSRHSEAGTPLVDMKLRGIGQRSGEGRELKPLK